MSVEITHEPTPPPRASGSRFKGGVQVNLVEESTGKTLSQVMSPDHVFYENERRTREERKY